MRALALRIEVGHERRPAGEHQRRADPLPDARPEQHRVCGRQRAKQQRDGTPSEAPAKDGGMTEEIADAAHGEQEARIGQHIGDDEPLDRLQRTAEGAGDGGKGDVDGAVQRDDAGAETDDKNAPASPMPHDALRMTRARLAGRFPPVHSLQSRRGAIALRAYTGKIRGEFRSVDCQRAAVELAQLTASAEYDSRQADQVVDVLFAQKSSSCRSANSCRGTAYPGSPRNRWLRCALLSAAAAARSGFADWRNETSSSSWTSGYVHPGRTAVVRRTGA